MSSIESIVPGGVGEFGGGPIGVVGSGVLEDSTDIIAGPTTNQHCAYSLDGVEWVGMPTGPQFNLEITIEESDIALDTDSGFRRVYRQFRREVWHLTFKVQQPALDAFEVLHQAVRGSLIPFYLTLDQTQSPIVSIYGKKIAGVVSRGTGDKAIPPVITYDLTIRSNPF